MPKLPLPAPIFDTPDKLGFDPILPKHWKNQGKFIASDYKCAHAFLYAYKDNAETYKAYRREVERLLLWTWLIHEKSILKLKRADLDIYLKFCQKPPVPWIGYKKPPHYLHINGEALPNPEWRPFVLVLSKAEIKQGKTIGERKYALSDKAFREIFTILSSFYNFLIHEELAEINPVQQIRQKSKYLRRQQGVPKVRRLSETQWKYVLETCYALAKADEKHERTLFIMTALYSMYLRISELTASKRWVPKMNDFFKDSDGNWWFTTVGKGNKERQIAVSNAMLAALKRWRKHLGLSPLPTKSDNSPLVPKVIGTGALASTFQVRKIVQYCFDQAEERLLADSLTEEAASLREATVHWLRHTGISDDVKRRPREHVRDDAGHSSSAITDKYIDIELKKRHESAREKPLGE